MEAKKDEKEVVTLTSRESSSGSMVVGVFKKLGTRTLAWLGVYLLGYFDFSIAWMITPLLLSVLRDQWKKEKRNRLTAAREAALTNEQTMIESRMRSEDLPSWVFFPDRERAEWVNSILKQLWPNINEYVRNILFKTVEPAVKSALEGFKLKGFKFERDRVYLGQIPPRVTGVKVYDAKVTSRNEIIMDLDIVFASDMEVVFKVSPVTARVYDFSLRGMVRVVLKPLISEIPLIGGVQVYFLTRPEIDFELGGVASAINIPAFRSIIDKIVTEQVANFIVLPNKFTMPLVSTIPTKILKCPDTAGVLRVHLHSAKNLVAKDIGIMGGGKSDPYGLLTVGATVHTVPVRKSTLDPSWELEYDFPIEVVHGQQLIMEFFDDDKGPGRDDEFLGRATVQTSVVADRGTIEKTWIDLEECDSGKVQLSLSWLPITRDPSVVKRAAKNVQPGNESAKALIHVYIDSVTGLMCGKGSYKPTPVVQVLNSQNNGRKTWPKHFTNDPIIEQGFVLLVVNPQVDNIKVSVLDSAKGDAEIANTVINVWSLIQEPDMEYNSQPWILKGNSPDAKIVMSASICGLLPPSSGSPIKQPKDKDVQLSQDPVEEDFNEELTGGNNSFDEHVQEGKIKITVHKAIDLEDKDIGGKSDPYVKIKYGGDKFKTETVKGSLTPVWEHEMWISTLPGGEKQIKFEVLDSDKIGKDEALGYTTVDVRRVSKQGKILNFWDRLQGCKKGRLLLSLEFFPANVSTPSPEEVSDNKQDTIPSLDGDVSPKSEETIPSLDGAVSPPLEEVDQITPNDDEEGTSQVLMKHFEDVSPEPQEEVSQNLGYMGKVVSGHLTVLVIKAVDLVKEDSFSGKSDPYLKITYDGKTSESDVHKNTLNPELNYEADFTVCEDGPTDIQIELFDKDVGKDEPLGNTTFDLRSVIEATEMKEVWVNLEGVKSGRLLVTLSFEDRPVADVVIPTGEDVVSLSLSSVVGIVDPNVDVGDLLAPENALRRRIVSSNGKLRMTIRYDEEESELKVFVHEAKDLPGGYLPDPPDPYVKLYLMPGKKKKKKTNVIKDTCSPRFDEEFDFNIKLKELSGLYIQANVLDKKGVFSKSPLMGRVTISLDDPSISQGIADWFPLEEAEDDSD